MVVKRSKLEIYLDILSVIKSGAQKPTRIMYRTNLSWVPMREILQSMIVHGLIVKRETEHRKRYEITEKGRTALESLNKAKELMVMVEAREKR